MKYPHSIASGLLLAFLVAALQPAVAVYAANAAVSDTNSASEFMAARDVRVAWWREARFGMFIHFGLYAIPAVASGCNGMSKFPSRNTRSWLTSLRSRTSGRPRGWMPHRPPA